MILMPAPPSFGHSINNGLHSDVATDSGIGSPSDLPFRNSPEMSYIEPTSTDYTQTALYTHGRPGFQYDATSSEFSPWSMPSLTPDTCVTAPYTPALAQGWCNVEQCSTMPTTPADYPFSGQSLSPRVMSPTRIYPAVPSIQTDVRPDSGIDVWSPIDSSIARSPLDGHQSTPFSYGPCMENMISAPVVNSHESLPGTPVDCRSPVGSKSRSRARKGSNSTSRRPSRRLPNDQSKLTDEWLDEYVMRSKARSWALILASINDDLPFTKDMSAATLQMRVHRANQKLEKLKEQQRPFDHIEQSALIESLAVLMKEMPQMLADKMANHGSAHKWSPEFIKLKLFELWNSDTEETAPVSKKAKASSLPCRRTGAATRAPLSVSQYTAPVVEGPSDRLSYQSPTSSMPSDLVYSAQMANMNATVWAPPHTPYSYPITDATAPLLIPMTCPPSQTNDPFLPQGYYQ